MITVAGPVFVAASDRGATFTRVQEKLGRNVSGRQSSTCSPTPKDMCSSSRPFQDPSTPSAASRLYAVAEPRTDH
jgi:hypothetical protein